MLKTNFTTTERSIVWVTLSVGKYEILANFLAWLSGKNLIPIEKSVVYSERKDRLVDLALNDDPIDLEFGFWAEDAYTVRRWLADHGAKDETPGAIPVHVGLAKTWAKLVHSLSADETSVKRIKELCENYTVVELREAMRHACAFYLKYDAGSTKPTPDSTILALNRVSRIATLRQRERANPYVKEFGIIQDKLRKNYRDADTLTAYVYMEKAHQLGVQLSYLMVLTDTALTWNRWVDELKAVISKAKSQAPLNERWFKVAGATIAAGTLCIVEENSLVIYSKSEVLPKYIGAILDDILFRWNKYALENDEETLSNVRIETRPSDDPIWQLGGRASRI